MKNGLFSVDKFVCSYSVRKLALFVLLALFVCNGEEYFFDLMVKFSA